MPEKNGKKINMLNVFGVIVSALLSVLIWISVDTKTEVRNLGTKLDTKCENFNNSIAIISKDIGKLQGQMGMVIEAKRIEPTKP